MIVSAFCQPFWDAKTVSAIGKIPATHDYAFACTLSQADLEKVRPQFSQDWTHFEVDKAVGLEININGNWTDRDTDGCINAINESKSTQEFLRLWRETTDSRMAKHSRQWEILVNDNLKVFLGMPKKETKQ